MKLLIYIIAITFSIGFICSPSAQDRPADNSKIVPNSTKTKMDSSVSKDSSFQDPLKLHYDAIVVDTHNDILMQAMENGVDISKEQPSTQSDLVKWIKGGL